MSEEMDSPNICVPEDTFEQFQAVTPCEDDDEFIMLSDIVPPQQPKLDLNACLHEIPEDPCAVSEPDPHLLVNVISEPSDESINQILNAIDLTDIDLSLATTSGVQHNNQIPKNDQQPTPMKRGRRKKSTFPSGLDYSESNNMLCNVTFDYYNSSLETVDQDSCITSYNKTSDMSNESLSAALTRSSRRTKRRPRQLSPEVPVKTKATSEAVADEVPKRKRGRPKKVVTPSNTLDLSKPNEVLPNQQHEPLHENVSSKISNHSNLISDINPSDPDKDISDVTSDTNLVQSLKLHIEKKKPGRRGRKKKCEIEATKTIEDEKLSDGNLDINTTTENSSNNSTKTRKRKSSKTAIDKKYDDIELELLRMLSTPTDEIENECKEPNDSNQNPPKKRSRKPKETVENLSQEQTSENSQIDKHDDEKDTHDDNDDIDDEICLSSLKKQLTPQEKMTEEPPSNTTDYDTVIENKEILNITKEAPAEDNKYLNISNEVVSVQHVLSETIENNITEPFPYKRSSKKPIMSDFEYNIDAVVKEPVLKSIVEETSAEASDFQQESSSKRPIRKKAKKVLHYDEGSDEDPFANVELSEDEGTSGRQGGRYYSDDEYIPGKIKKGKNYTIESESSISESDELENIEEVISKKHLVKRKGKKKLISKSDVTSTAADTTTQNDEDLTDLTESPDITTNDNSIQRPKQAWGMSHEFEKFISQKIQGTNLQIKKVSGATSNESSIAPLEIPVLDPKEPKKSTEVGTQTNKSLTQTVEVQTSAPYEGKMKAKIPLSEVQSERACIFLKGIVKNTADLGQLMIQKSEDFIQKKINTTNVTDTNKLEYCVQKSFLLFKLAKHNLIQMEEDLANAYEQYLKRHNLSHFRDSPKVIVATPRPINSDSDCEIVEENIQQKQPAKDKSKFNLKTVFLNKELSIKIAKKPEEEAQTKKEQLNVKGRHTVWINDSIMVKKVKPTQSFLAQDSRNKKPPDTYVTLEMVKTFFDNYYKQQRVLSACSPFVSPQWLEVNQISICSYFIADSDDMPHSGVLVTQQQASDSNNVIVNNEIKDDNSSQPRSLQTLCTRFWQNYLYENKYDCKDDNNMPHSGVLLTQQEASDLNNVIINNETKDDNSSQPRSLQTLCTRFWHNYLYENKYDCKDDSAPIKNSQVIQKYQPERLFTLSFDVISIAINDDNNILMQKYQNKENIINSLKTICLRNISKLIFQPQVIRNTMYTQMPVHEAKVIKMPQKITNEHPRKLISKKQIKIKTLFTICIQTLQKTGFVTQNIDKYEKVKSLKRIALDTIKRGMFDYLCYPDDTFDGESGSGLCREMFDQMESWLENGNYIDNINKEIELTIKSVNTMSDDIFANIPDNTIQDNTSYLDDDESNFSNYDQYDYEGYNQENVTAESNWVSRVQLQELKSCIVLINDTSEILETNDSNADCVTQIKLEPLDEPFENVHSSIVKTEPTENDEEIINFTPLTTKLENITNLSDTDARDPCLPEPIISSYDMDSFEAFANSNKMLRTGIDYSLANDEVFSQSAQRVRKQHEPDMEDDNDIGMSLLVPHQSIEVAKDRLMESSSDENISTQKNISKKKRKIRPKNTRQKIKDVTTNKDKNLPENEVTVLTRRMQERMRQVEKSDDSSDSDLESSLTLRRESSKKAQDKAKHKPNKDEEEDNQIQCNDVDSTDNLVNKLIPSDENNIKKTVKKGPKTLLQIKNREDKSQDIKDFKGQDNSFVIKPDDPVELLECEPTLPMMLADYTEMESDNVEKPNDPSALEQETTYIERHGWKCFPVNNNDSKLYEYAFISLEKLPESFVETYFKYQGMAGKDQDDADIDRLTNLQSLHRNVSKENKGRSNSSKVLPNGQFKSKYPNSGEVNNADNDHCAEFSPSEDEGPNIDDEVAPPAPHQDAVENAMAKNSLMDIGSDSERPDKLDDKAKNNQSIKKEKDDQFTSTIRTRPGPKSKKLALAKKAESLMLTADKMMNKELALLHAPVILEADEVDIKDVPKKITPKSATRTSSRLQAHLERNTEKDSSSEEEKQWVNTKEKLLKRMVKNQENPRVDDAKRAKLVSEFIERRGDGPENRPRLRPRKLRSRKKFLERQKQISVLNRELFGEVDTTYTGRKHSQSLGKGRKNIRKVIDKKSLARSTVIANMEEFERKRRLNMQQMRLREVLGCEEGVNVLVINEEVCLEYDFEQMRPVVTIHPFFTKVMKAHQYEGVKFMWDACFESLSMVATGHAGGGCILAHCMGLGKTLQVLALLHTVLTHPGVGMQRVLVCCPLSTVLNWVDEIHKWIGPVTNQIKVFELSKLKKTYERAYQLEDWYSGGGIFIIGYELFRNLSTLDPVLDDIRPTIVNKIRTALLDPGPDIVICDEGHLLKNDASVLAVAMSRVSTRRRIVLTGTPMQNNLREYYCMVNFVKPSLLGTYSEYSNRFENPIMNGQHRDSREEDIKLMKARTHILHKVLEGCLQRQEASVLYPYLPKKHEYTVFIPPTKCQWDLYKHYIMKYALEQQQQQKQQKHSVLKDFHVLQKIWTHPQVLHNFLMKARDERNKFNNMIKEEKIEDDLAHEELAAFEDMKPSQTEVWWLQYLAGGDMLESLDSSNKFLVVFQLLEECIALGDKVLIFSTSLYTLDALEYFLKRINKWSLGQQYYRLDGSVPPEVRQKWCREFNAEININTKLFLISTRAGSLGLNLTAANRVIILDTSWNPAHDIQSIFRVYRFGQKKDCYIYRLVAMGTMEQKIYERSVAKQAVSCRVVDEQQIDRHYNMAELTELYRYDEEGSSVEAGLAAGVSDVALLRVAARARLHAVREHDSLLRGSREQHLPEHERNAAWMQFQEEHANKEMQNRLLEASQGIHRLMEADLAKASGSIVPKTENEEQAQPPPAPKGRRGRKGATANATPTPPPEESKTEQKEVKIDHDKEEAKVRKIMELLIKHNFHTTKQSHDITQLVGNVRRIVDAGGTGLDQCDELTRSIATVMLQEEDGTVASEIPPLTDIVAEESIPSSNEIEIKSEAEPATSLDDDRNDGSLLVPVGELVRRTRGRPRKYSSTVQPTPTPTVKRSRGRPRKVTSDSDRSTLDDDSVLAELQGNSGMKSARLKNKPRRSYGSDSDDAPLVASVFSSREQSPVSNDAPAQKKIKGGKRSGIFPADSESSLIDDASNGSSEVITKKRGPKSKTMIPVESSINLIDDDDDSMDRVSEVSTETVEVPIVPQEEIVKKKSRAIAVKSTAKSAMLQSVDPSNLNGKTKRKAALAAEHSLESLDSDIVALDDDDEWTDDRVVRNKAEKNDKTSSEMESTIVERKRFPSITVSDDEDASPNKTEAKEAVPLHPSMLSNANFIKIVAYAYQSNQLLDEDAAVLAAQYSTQKALKEVETTGKEITSGPLYDIAVKVLGKDVLKRLYEKKEIKKNDASISRSLKKATKQDATAGNEITVPERNPPQNKPKIFEPVSKHPSVVPIGMFKGYSGNQKTPEVVEECILPDDDDVILGSTDNKPTPEPYYKQNSQPLVITSVSSKTPGAAAEEAIIPESYSQGQIFMSNTQPMFRMRGTKIEPVAPRTEAPSTVGSQQIMYRAMNPSVGTPTVPQLVQPSAIPVSQAQYLTLTISDGKLVFPQSIVPDVTYTTTVPGSAPAPSNNTICLDSDEEDSAPPRRAPPTAQSSLANPRSLPTPVAVTTNTPHSVMTSVQEMPHILRPDNSEAAITPDIQTRIPQNSLPAPTFVSASHQRSTNSTVKTTSKPPGYTVSYTQNKQNKGPQIITKEKAFDLLKNKETTEAIKNRCKPGDIVRITKSGNFEVLTRAEKMPDNTKPQTLLTTANESTSLVDRRKPSTTSSVGARPASPGNDPLSILKDVIHIQADEYGVSPTKSNVRIDKGNPGLAKSSISITKDAMNNRSGSSKTEPKQSASNSLLNPNATKNKIDFNTKLLLFKKNLKGLNLKKQASNNTLSPQPVRASIDLTHIETANTNMGDTNKATKSANTVMVGSSKDIIIRGKSSGKATTSHMNTVKISSQMPKPSTSSSSKSSTLSSLKSSTLSSSKPSTLSSSKSSTLSLSKLSSSLPTKPSASTSKQSTSSLLKPSTVVSKTTPTDEKVHKLKLRFPPSSRLVNVKSEASALSGDKKRPSQWPASEPKKQKTGLLSRPTMTLKDFNIDDIDDIIELE